MPSSDGLIPDDDRPRGILSQADRQFLRGEKEYNSEQSKRDARYRIRERVKNSILDFSILYQHLDQRDRDQIFSPLSRDHEEVLGSDPEMSKESVSHMIEEGMFIAGITDCLSFFYRETQGRNISFEDMFREAVRDMEEQKGYIVNDVSLKIDIEREQPEMEDLINRLNQGDSLTKEEISAIIRSEEFDINPEHLDELFQQIVSDATDSIEDVSDNE